MVSYGNTVQTLDVWLNEGIVDFRNNRFQCLFLAYIFPKLSIYRQGILLKQWNAGEIIMYILQSGLIGPSKRYLRIIIYMDARRIIWDRGITSSFQCEVATDKSKGINLRNFIVGCCSFVQEYRDRRYPVVGHASL